MSLAVLFRLLPLGGNNDDAVETSRGSNTMVCGSSLGNDDSEDEWASTSPNLAVLLFGFEL